MMICFLVGNATAEYEEKRSRFIANLCHVESEAEAMEFIASENCKLNGIALKNLNLKPNIIIACVSRHNTVIIPDGNTEIRKGDSVIIITAGQRIVDLNEILL